MYHLVCLLITLTEEFHSITPQLIDLAPDQSFWTAFASRFLVEKDAASTANEMLSHIVVAAIDSFKTLRATDVEFFIQAAKFRGAQCVRNE